MQPGSRLGPYEILSRIGAGGMGEVWRARDTRLAREVAIKILPAEFAQDAKLKIRFEREARAIAHLTHPNICTLFDVGENYLVMELLEGESLAERLPRGALTLTEVLRYGVQLAEALGQAHKQGVVHRDVKPGNVVITKAGAKLLDFGLAKSTRVEAASRDETVQKPITEQGAILGTFQYMAPEQLAGEEPDARTDIFALGVVLYEMATGKRAFEGNTRTSLVSAIMSGEPRAMSALQPLTPPALEHVIMKCLEKERDDRWQSASDIAEELRWISQEGSKAGPAIPAEGHRRVRAGLRWFLAAAALVVVAAGGWLFASARRAGMWGAGPPQVRASDEAIRFQIAFPAETPLVTAGVAISPDGRTLAYVRRSGETTRLHLRSLGSLEDTSIEGSAGAASPFFSPDGTAVGFVADDNLKKARLPDGQVTTLAETGVINGGTWGRDGTIVYASARTGTLFAIGSAGGGPREITRLQPGETMHSDPQLLADDRTVLFSTTTGFGLDAQSRIDAVDPRSAKRRPAFDPRGSANVNVRFRFVNGSLLFVLRTSLYAIRFDPERAETAGEAVAVVDPMSMLPFAISDTGTIVYFSPGAGGWTLDAAPVRVMRASVTGAPEPLPIPSGPYGFLALSPDEQHLALTGLFNERGRILTADLLRGTVSPLSGAGSSHIALWTPDSERVIYSWTGGGPSNLVMQRADGSDELVTLVESPNHQDPGSFSPDGRWLAYAERDPDTMWDIWLLPMTGPRTTPRAYLRSGASEYSPMISPDARRIAYVVGGGDYLDPQVFINTFPDPSRRVHVGAGRDPHWSRDGARLYYSRGDGVFVVNVSSDGALTSARQVVNDAEFGPGFGVAPFAALSDDSLLFMRRTSAPTLTVVTNWTRELEKLMKR